MLYWPITATVSGVAETGWKIRRNFLKQGFVDYQRCLLSAAE